jgi:hypothetical protein
MWHRWEKGEVPTGIWSENLKERDRLEDLGVDRSIKLKYIFKNWDGEHGLD